MDTSEPLADLLEETYEIETDQNNNIVLIKCKAPVTATAATAVEPIEKAVIEINNNSVPPCKAAAGQQSTANSQPTAKPNDQPDEAAITTLVLNVPSDSKAEAQVNEPKVNGEEKAPVKPNLTSLQQPSSSSNSTSSTTTNPTTTTTPSTNTGQIAKSNSASNSNSSPVNHSVNKSSNDKVTVISKLRKIAADSVHNAIKFKKVDEQTAITTANGVPKEKKVLKCANNGNEPTSAENSVKIGRIHLADQLAKSRNQAEELSSSPNENDQTLAQSPPVQLQSQTKKSSPSTNSSSPSNGKLKIPWNDKIDSWWHDLVSQVDDECEPVWIDAEHPLFILYTR